MNNDIPVVSSAFNRVNGSNGSSLWTPTSAASSSVHHQPFILAPPPAGTASHGSNHHHNNSLGSGSNNTNGGTSTGSPMKVPVKPPPLKSLPPLSGYGGGQTVPLSPSGLNMADRLPLPHLTLPFSPDILWRYPTQFSALTSSSPASGGPGSGSAGHPQHHSHHSQQPSSPHLDVKPHLPGALGPDPRTWAREDVVTFLRWCEREFDLPGLDLDKFQMNGKALCLLNKSDIAERAPGSGDVVHNALQLLLRDAPYTGRVPSSPLTPHPHTAHQQHLLSHALAAAAAHQQQQQQQQNSSSSGSNSGGSGNNGGGSHLLSPPNSARTPTSASGWPSANQLFSSADFHSLGHLIQQTNSVTLSPAPSVSDGSGNSQGGSPSHAEQSAAAAAAAAAMAAQAHINFYTQALAQAHNQAQAAAANSAHHHHNQAGSNSGSQSDSEENDSVQDNSPARSPAPSTPIHLVPPPMSPLATTFSSAASSKNMEKDPLATTPISERNGGGGDGLDSGSNGRLLWDFLQQLLNDPSQRYSHYIAWKNRETGVFKITDPAGLARLWGIQKNHPSMNYDKMSRALRYYYRVNILRKVQGERHCYQFLRNPIELKSIKNISLLRHQMAAAAAAAATTTTTTTASGSSGSSASSGKMADSTDASLERYSPSSSCNAPDQDFEAEPRRFANNNNNEQDPEDNDCDMPTDLSMERRGINGTNPYLTSIKTENMAS